MAILRPGRARGRLGTHRGRVLVYARRGALIIAKWPRKRGTPKSAKQRFWIDWFKQANRLANFADQYSQARAREMAKGTGVYWRDVLLMAMRGRLYHWTDETGWTYYSMAAIGDISGALDVLAQQIGSVLVRATDRWRRPLPDPAPVGSVLTYQGDAAPPIWASAGGGVSQVVVVGSPVVVDGSQNAYTFAVSIYSDVQITLEDIGFAAPDSTNLRLSTDGGATYRAGASDYWLQTLTSGGENAANEAQWRLSRATSAAAHQAIAHLTNLRAGRANFGVDAARSTTQVGRRGGYARFAGPITNIQILSSGGNNFNAGTIRLTGILAA